MMNDAAATDPANARTPERWARLRFAVVGPLLAAPPSPGDLHDRLRLLAAQSWRHPLSGQPAFSGLIAATALAPTAIEAETLAKMALLQGPSAARNVLSRYGGITVAEDGTVDRIGQLHPAPRLKITIPSSMIQKGTQ